VLKLKPKINNNILRLNIKNIFTESKTSLVIPDTLVTVKQREETN